MNIKRLIPHYVLRSESTDCDCDIDDSCDCMDELVLTKDGCTGYGVGTWVMTDDTCPANINDYGRAYWCEFLGFPGFWACGENDAAETLSLMLDRMGFPANVNFKFNSTAERFKKENNL